MAESVLLLWLEGPMQSWGTRARWDVRDTALEPTKSGIIGLVGCAKGLQRGNPELEKLDAELLYGVRIDRAGVVSTDYQTVTGYHRTAAGGFKHAGGTASTLDSAMKHGESTVVSPRDYIHDAVFLIALQGESSTLTEIRNRIANPRWPLFLGRKSCPPSGPLIAWLPTEYSNAEDAFACCPRHRRSTPEGKIQAYIEDPTGNLERQDAMRLNPLRMYEFRRCRYLEVDPPCISPD